VYAAPLLRVAAVGALTWGLTTLLLLPPKIHTGKVLPEGQFKHLLLVLDVSPSMRLTDAGPLGKQTRMRRARDVLDSFFQRVPAEQYRVSVVACYNGAKPVVIETKDMEVVRNILSDLPMHYAFPPGKTDIFSGLQEAARVARPWNPGSTVVVLVSDGDTVPAVGMPKMPASVSSVLVVGVGDPLKGKFIDGHLSRQDASTLRQIATRLGGTYHDGNEKHLSTELLEYLMARERESAFQRLTLREYALLACGLGAAVLALLPVLLHYLGTTWQPGVKVEIERIANGQAHRDVAHREKELSPDAGASVY
jgi:Ca-activated chloride channel family protein